MCQQVQQCGKITNSNKKMKASYSITRVLKTLFKHKINKSEKKQHKIYNSVESLESMDNLRNSQIEEVLYEEIDDNAANEKLAMEEEIYVPVRFARTTVGTFFWTTNLQPVTSTIMPAADTDLLQPAYCYSNNQYPYMQFQDRWAQA